MSALCANGDGGQVHARGLCGPCYQRAYWRAELPQNGIRSYRWRMEPGAVGTQEAMEITGATFRQVDYWCRAGYIPGQPPERGSGQNRVFDPDQIERMRHLVHAAAIQAMLVGDLATLLAGLGDAPS